MLVLATSGQQPLEYLSCGRFVSEQAFLHPTRQLDNFVVLFGLIGEIAIACADREYTLKPNSMLLLPPHLGHCGAAPSSYPLSYYWCHFTCRDAYQLLDTESAEAASLWAEASQHAGLLLPLHAQVGAPDRPLLIFQQLMHIAYTQYKARYAADYCLSLLAAELTEQCASPDTFKAINQSKLSEITEWIRINMDKPLSVHMVAEKFGYSPDYLSVLFRKYTGFSVVQYIRNLRINRARELLLYTHMHIQEIAYAVGYTDEKYFMRQFKAVENMSPTKFRNAYTEKHMNNR